MVSAQVSPGQASLRPGARQAASRTASRTPAQEYRRRGHRATCRDDDCPGPELLTAAWDVPPDCNPPRRRQLGQGGEERVPGHGHLGRRAFWKHRHLSIRIYEETIR